MCQRISPRGSPRGSPPSPRTFRDRYKAEKLCGQGTYGQVHRCEDRLTNDRVAVKKLFNTFGDLEHCKKAMREIRMLSHFDQENILSLRDLVVEGEDVYMVTDLLDTDLHKIIKSSQPLTEGHIQFFIYQTLVGLREIHRCGAIHRDVKPGNLLVNCNCELKICDFGMSRQAPTAECEENNVLSEYVVTRWYRAPELLLQNKHYTDAVDMWSVGCVLAELLGRVAIFRGENYLHMLKLIVHTLGNPTEEDLSTVTHEKAVHYLRSLMPSQGIPFATQFPAASIQAIDLLQRLLVFNPAKRLSAEAALHHPFLQKLSEAHVSSTSTGEAVPVDFSFEAQDFGELKQLIHARARQSHASSNGGVLEGVRNIVVDGHDKGSASLSSSLRTSTESAEF